MTPETRNRIKSTQGALSVAEAIAISQVAATVPSGACVECGTFHGKSAMAAASGLLGERILHLIDPAFAAFSDAEMDAIRDGVSVASGGRIQATLHARKSSDALPAICNSEDYFAWVFLDSGEHTYELVRSELDIVVPRMKRGGVIGFHDFMSQFIGVEKGYRELLSGGQFEEVAIPWDDIVAQVDAHGMEDGNVTYHHTELQNPMFFGALRKL